MNKILTSILVLFIISTTGFGIYKAAASIDKGFIMKDKKVLIAYYSYSGNTKSVAKKIQSLTGADLFEIKPLKEYSKNYNEVVSLAQIEKQNNIKPELVNNGDVSNYDVIFIGTPVWWYTMASPVRTFLSNNNFDGKIIMPFCTHGGGGASSTYIDMKKLAPKAKFTDGYTSYENSAKIEDIKNWIKSANI